jgi:hypothetical protein
LRAVDRAGEHAGSFWAKALDQVSSGIRETVEQTYKQWNTILRDYLRTETGLRLAVVGDSQSVPIKGDSGMPPRFIEVVRQFEGLEWLFLNRPPAAEAATGTGFRVSRADAAKAVWGDEAGPAVASEIQRVQETATNWFRKLDGRNAVKQIIGIEEDVLGAYFFRIPKIRQYWVVIGIKARTLGVTVEALQAYQALLKEQSGSYRAHLNRIEGEERGGEIVRVSMIECRSRRITVSSNFSETIKRHRHGVRRRKQEVTSG